ncbi:TrmH family RNA methyltransferase [Acidihalobacter aeolianus]|uniref:TrmH family RNA methyltransferase n=1 Tax=Acidihalobacter aeolianus TaxID=2792603 RepID=UPI0009F67332|nr:TrmH family RNA methyltransferase [Acidihalobacter aeolianus]
MENIQLVHDDHHGELRRFPLSLLVHDMAAPENVGSLFRLADALGVEKLYLTGTTPLPPNRKIRKTSRAAEKYVPHEYATDPLAVVGKLQADGYRVVSLDLTTASLDLAVLPVSSGDRICLVLGSENAGVSQALLDASDFSVHIPMRGLNSSMNVAMACAIAAYEIIGMCADETGMDSGK